MNLFIEVYRVNQFEKLAGLPVQELITRKIDIWRQMKTAAARDPQGIAVGLARQVLGHAADRLHTGEKLAADQSELITAAASIGSAHAVDLAIDRMVKTGELTRHEATQLSTFNVESVFFELGRLFKTAKSGCAHPDGSFCDKCKCPHDMNCGECPTCRLSKAASEHISYPAPTAQQEKTGTLLEQLGARVRTKEAFLDSMLRGAGGLARGIGSWGARMGSALTRGATGGMQAFQRAPQSAGLLGAVRQGAGAFGRGFQRAGGMPLLRQAAPAAYAAGGYGLARMTGPRPPQQRPQQPGMLPGM